MHYELFYRELLRPDHVSPIIILGTSKSGESVDPAILEKLGLDAVNFSTDNSDPSYYEIWYKELFEKHYPKPRLIVYCVDWVMFEHKGRVIEYDSEYFPFKYFVSKLLDPRMNRTILMANRFPLFKYRAFLTKLMRGRYTYYPWRMEDAYRGFVPVEGVGDLKKVKVTGMDALNPEILKAFDRLLDTWKAQGIPVIFAQTPDYLPGRESENLVRNSELIQKIADDRGIPYIDYNSDHASPLNFEKKMYRDWTHLNKRGSEIFSLRFAADLKELIARHKFL